MKNILFDQGTHEGPTVPVRRTKYDDFVPVRFVLVRVKRLDPGISDSVSARSRGPNSGVPTGSHMGSRDRHTIVYDS